jgi:hypothetical protein
VNQNEEIKRKINRLQERFILEEIDRELYEKYIETYKADQVKLEEDLIKSSHQVSNP